MLKRNLLLPVSLLFGFLSPCFAADQLVIISPHRKSIQTEYIPLFEAHYKKAYGQDIKVEWIDQGGTENDVRFLESKYEKTPNSSGIDVFWGGGDLTFTDMDKRGFLEKLPKEILQSIPDSVVGIPLSNKNGTWVATAISSFGIFYNKRILKMQNIPTPATWEDIGNPNLMGMVSVADPRRSATSLVMSAIMLKTQSWEKGWESLTRLAANTRNFTQSSSDPIKDVVSGDAAMATAVDFYAAAKVAELGEQNLGFVLPAGKTVFNSDPAAILKGAVNKKAAERFIQFVLTVEGQKLLVLKQNAPGGPKQNILGRMAVTAKAYEGNNPSDMISQNPFTMPVPKVPVDLDQLGAQREVLGDLIGAIHCDTHKELQQAWKAVIARGSKPDDLKILFTPPVTQGEFDALTKVWGDQVVRNRTINQWINTAKSRYLSLAEQKSS